jgi:DNA-binding response OmpR family regulator
MDAMNVLVVEDSPEYTQIVTSVLKQAGHRVRAASTIADALESMSAVPRTSSSST